MFKRTLYTFYNLSFIFNLAMSFFFATYSLFLLDRGLNYFELHLVNVACMLAGAFLEIPTGSFADNFGRKKVVIASFFIYSLSFLIYFSGANLFIFIGAEIVAALAGALFSGAFDAWAVDELNFHQKGFKQSKLFATRSKIKNLAWLIGPVIGGFVGSYNLAIPWLLSSGTMLIAGIIALIIIKENGFKIRNHEERIGMRQIASDSIRYGLKNKAIFFLGLAMMLSAFTAMPFNMLWQPIAQNIYQVPVALMGIIFAIIIMFIIAGNHLAEKLGDKGCNEKKIILFSLLLFGLSSLLASQRVILPLGALAFFLHDFSRGILIPSAETYMHKRIPSDKRATISSAVKMAERFAGGIGMLVSGIIAEKTQNPLLSWAFVSAVLLIGTVLLTKVKNGE